MVVKRLYCGQCDSPQKSTRQHISHLLHFIVSLVTLGMWLPVWFGVALVANYRWTCDACGAAVKLRGKRA